MSLNQTSKIEGTLFTIPKDKRKENGPIMEGDFQITGENGKIKGAAWMKEKDEGPGKPPSLYLSFQLELNRDQKFYGAIFPTDPSQKTADKAPDYFGTFNLTREKGGPVLRIAGWKRKGNKEPHTPFISVLIEAPRPRGAGNEQQPSHHREAVGAGGLPI
ncbi:hypothetical protein [Ottowia sp.]|uniref:hypothetical protein n=1 Tax=Ottowia sp. TaxID=1898956 RepID=UPI0025EC67C8|nr:hypothetical protein [Ottowia sp.]MBK6616154.1 hypothetical protein [Ottowia sp.]